MNDEHRPAVDRYAEDDIVRTLALDRLTKTGTLFTNAYTLAPICMLARHAVRTGQQPYTWDRFGFDAFQFLEYRTLFLKFARHGHMTANGGKNITPVGISTSVGRSGSGRPR